MLHWSLVRLAHCLLVIALNYVYYFEQINMISIMRRTPHTINVHWVCLLTAQPRPASLLPHALCVTCQSNLYDPPWTAPWTFFRNCTNNNNNHNNNNNNDNKPAALCWWGKQWKLSIIALQRFNAILLHESLGSEDDRPRPLADQHFLTCLTLTLGINTIQKVL